MQPLPQDNVLQVGVNSNELSEDTALPHPDNDYTERPLPLVKQLEEAHNTISDRAQQLQDEQVLLSRFQGDNKDIVVF